MVIHTTLTLFHRSFPVMLLAGVLLWSGPAVSDVDEVIQKEETVLLIRYSPWSRHRCSPGKLRAWITGENKDLEWTSIVKPHTQFVPLQVLFGQSRNVLVVERVERRIWQLDSSMQVLSSMKLPEEIREGKLEEYRMFWNEGHRFTFINVSAGTVFQYLETGGRLSLLHRSRIPLSCRECYPARGDTASYEYENFPFLCTTPSSLIAFDRSFSGSRTLRSAAVPFSGTLPEKRSRPVLVLDGQRKPVLIYRISDWTFCFKPEKREFSYCP